jgi:hypothetical protein
MKNSVKIIFIVLSLISCNKKGDGNYKCNNNCSDININLLFVDSSLLLDKSYMKNIEYDIYLDYNPGGLFSEPEEYLIKSGKTSLSNSIKEKISVDKNQLETNQYSISIRLKINSNITTCKNPNSYYILGFPVSGIVNDTLILKKNISKNVTITRKLTDTFSQADLYVDCNCESLYLQNLSIKLNETKFGTCKFPINSWAFFRIRKFKLSGGYIDKVDSVYINENYKGQNLEY